MGNIVADLIPAGKVNAISRKTLVAITGIPDREVRERIENARAAGALICNDQDGQGYYLAESREEIQRQLNRDYARLVSLAERMKPFKNALAVMDGQLGIND